MGFLKLNVDTSFDHNLLRGAVDAVLKDDKGKFIVGRNSKIDRCVDVLTKKVLALRFGLLLAQKIGCNRLVINSVNMEIINIMKNGGHSAEWQQ